MTEILETDNQYYRGVKFEQMFGEFMKSDLGWDGVRIRAQQKGKGNNKGAQVDIIGFRRDDRGRRLYNLSVLYLIIGVVLILLSLLMILLYENDELSIYLDSGIIVGVISIVGAWYCNYTYKHYEQENAWVECKNRKGKATYEQVQKCINEYEDYIASGDKEYKYVSKYFVSSAGFVENALKLALKKGFDCYELKDGKFVKSEYWQ